jgi:hypothetical protein
MVKQLAQINDADADLWTLSPSHTAHDKKLLPPHSRETGQSMSPHPTPLRHQLPPIPLPSSDPLVTPAFVSKRLLVPSTLPQSDPNILPPSPSSPRPNCHQQRSVARLPLPTPSRNHYRRELGTRYRHLRLASSSTTGSHPLRRHRTRRRAF